MASIQKVKKKDGSVVFRVQLYVNGIRDSESFDTKAEAKIWALQREAEIRTQPISAPVTTPISDPVPPAVSLPIPTPAKESKVLTLRDVLQRYKREVSPKKGGRHWEEIRLDKFCTQTIASIAIKDLGPEHLAEWRDARLKQVSSGSVRREMTLLASVLETAKREWRLIATNPARDVRKPPDSPHRKQRISVEDLQKLIAALGYTEGAVPRNKSQEVAVCLLLAIETACRSGELLGLTRPHVHLKERYIHLPTTKNGSSRDVPLSPVAVGLLTLLLNRPARSEDRLFTVSAQVKDALFRRAKHRVGLSHIHFHDSRREATSRLSESFNPLELSRITGHKDLKMLLTYYEKSASELAKKMN